MLHSIPEIKYEKNDNNNLKRAESQSSEESEKEEINQPNCEIHEEIQDHPDKNIQEEIKKNEEMDHGKIQLQKQNEGNKESSEEEKEVSKEENHETNEKVEMAKIGRNGEEEGKKDWKGTSTDFNQNKEKNYIRDHKLTQIDKLMVEGIVRKPHELRLTMFQLINSK